MLASCGGHGPATSTTPASTVARPAYLPSGKSTSLVDITTDAYGAFSAAPNAPSIGDIAPDFSLPTTTGETFSLAEAVSAGEVAIVFFRGFW